MRNLVRISFISLFGIFRTTWRIFHAWGGFTITGKALQISTYTRHIEQWELHPLYDHPQGSVTLTPRAEPLAVWHKHLGLSWLGFEHLGGFFMRANVLIACATATVK